MRLPLTLYPDQAEKTPRGKPRLKVLDGRHRLQFASALGKPVRVELFKGTEDEARDFVASLNLSRRSLTAAQCALAIERLYGEQARAEAKQAKIEGAKQPKKVLADLPGPNGDKSGTSNWEHRAVKLAGGGASPRTVRYMADVAKAPETAARVDRNEIRTVSQAVKEAAIELGKPEPPKPWDQPIRTELGSARGHLRNALASLNGSVEVTKSTESLEVLDEIVQLTGEIRVALGERGVRS